MPNFRTILLCFALQALPVVNIDVLVIMRLGA